MRSIIAEAAAAPACLTEGGVMQFLANWLHISGEDWRERVAGWITTALGGDRCDAWIVQREVCDPVEYVNLWLRDASEPYDPARAQAWLDWFDSQKAEAVGFGLVTIRRGERDAPVVRVEDLRQVVEPPLGEQVAAWFDRQDWLAAHRGDALLPERLRRVDGLRLVQESEHDGGDWEVSCQRVSLPGGLRWSEEVDPVALALISGADGTVALRDQVAVLSAAIEAPEPVLAETAVPIVAHLVERGYLLPAGPGGAAAAG